MTAEIYLLDTNILSKILFPKTPETKAVALWFMDFLNNSLREVYFAEIVSYEIRRGLLHQKLKHPDFKGIDRLNELSKYLTFLPINSNVFRIAEELWAKARFNGNSTASKDSLDADVILAAQAIDAGGAVITENVKHLQNYVKTFHWNQLKIS